VIVLNGGSSSGKTSIARGLQELLPSPWLRLGIDDLIRAMPDTAPDAVVGLDFAADGSITVGDEFRRAERSWYEGLAAIARDGTGLVVDEVFLGGAASQERLAAALAGLRVFWVGVRCDASVASEREAARGDRFEGMARAQAEAVHEGVVYDLEVDTAAATSMECARAIVDAADPFTADPRDR
jgi:chloramphenicol 3-O phosphotransferase